MHRDGQPPGGGVSPVASRTILWSWVMRCSDDNGRRGPRLLVEVRGRQPSAHAGSLGSAFPLTGDQHLAEDLRQSGQLKLVLLSHDRTVLTERAEPALLEDFMLL
jgi:hypothetical protein